MSAFPLLRSLHQPHWLVLWAATLGFLLDAMDVLLYVFALQSIRAEFHLSNAQAGLVSSATLFASAAGGMVFGYLSDRLGRRRTLIYTILLYSLASAGSATATGLPSLLFWRALIGLGLGGEWAAGAVLVAEAWPAEHRGKAIGFMQSGWALGYMLAAALSALVLPRFGWRVLFLVGVLPALVTLWIRRRVPESRLWSATAKHASWTGIFCPPLLRRTLCALALTASVLFAYWGLFTWLPGFLAASPSEGGAGMGLVRSSAWVFVLQVGAFAGYLAFGFLADRWGRRPAFVFYMLGAAALTPLFGALPTLWGAQADRALLALAPLLGFFGSGYFSLFGALLAELYPTSLRGLGQGFSYNFGRVFSALAPFVVGATADRKGFAAALALNAAFFLAGAAFIYTLPETRHASLEHAIAE